MTRPFCDSTLVSAAWARSKTVTRNLNRVIDHNFYPVEEARNSNLKHRPIGLGVQGLADTFIVRRCTRTHP